MSPQEKNAETSQKRTTQNHRRSNLFLTPNRPNHPTYKHTKKTNKKKTYTHTERERDQENKSSVENQSFYQNVEETVRKKKKKWRNNQKKEGISGIMCDHWSCTHKRINFRSCLLFFVLQELPFLFSFAFFFFLSSVFLFTGSSFFFFYTSFICINKNQNASPFFFFFLSGSSFFFLSSHCIRNIFHVGSAEPEYTHFKKQFFFFLKAKFSLATKKQKLYSTTTAIDLSDYW